MSDSLISKLCHGAILVADGAMGTMLMQRGLGRGLPPESFTLDHPDIVAEVTSLYLQAGAQVVQTNTFGASPMKLAEYGLAGKVAEINARAVEIARRSVGQEAWVMASCGPSGKLLKPYGVLEAEEAYDGFVLQIQALYAAGVDAIGVETMTDIREAVLAVRACKTVCQTIPVVATMTFEKTVRGFFTVMGVGIAQAVAELTAAGADILGSNCGNGMTMMVEIAREFQKHSTLPLQIRANAGLPLWQAGALVYPETPAFMAANVSNLTAAGVAIIGGCCGTNPEHIAAIRRAVECLPRPSL